MENNSYTVEDLDKWDQEIDEKEKEYERLGEWTRTKGKPFIVMDRMMVQQLRDMLKYEKDTNTEKTNTNEENPTEDQ